MAKKLEWYIEKYGMVDGTERHTAIRKRIGESSKGKNSLYGFISRYGEVEGKKRYETFVGKSVQTLDGYIEKYGEVSGTLKYKELCDSKTKNLPNKKEYWLRMGFSEEDAVLMISKFQDKFSLSSMIEKYGEIDGTKKHMERCVHHSFAISLGGFISRYGEECGRIRFNEYNKLKSCSLDMYILRYGEEEGVARYNSHIEKNKSANSKDGFIEKYGNIDGERKWKEKYEFLRNWNLKFYSVESIRYLISLYKMFRKNGVKRDDVYWGIHEHGEFFLQDDEGRIFFYDFVIPKLNIIVEYHGVAFHPKEGDVDWVSPFGVAYIDAITKDLHKEELAISRGYKFISVYSDRLPPQSEIFDKLQGRV